MAAVIYVRFLSSDLEIFNVDESSIPITFFLEKGWGRRNQKLVYKKLKRLDRISIIAAISNKGRSFFSINFGSNNADTFLFFIFRLCLEF